MSKLQTIDKVIMIMLEFVVIFLALIIIINTTKLIDSFIIANDKLSTHQTVNYELPVIMTIDCETELKEGDIISDKLYNPYGEWSTISQDNIQYQLMHGGRLIQCK